MPQTLLIATKNPGKAREFREMLGSDWTVLTALDLPGLPDVVEDGTTFEANAVKKALACVTPQADWILADDSGLEVDALHGAPGVFSARFAGTPSNDASNNALLLEKLDGVAGADRGAQFRCVLALVREGRLDRTFHGICRGRILQKPAGQGGFGYDPLFLPDGYLRTFAELDSEVKHRISHRGQAMQMLIAYLQQEARS